MLSPVTRPAAIKQRRPGERPPVTVRHSDRADIIMAQTAAIKTPYIMVVRRNLVRFIVKTKVSLKRSFSPALSIYQEEEFINEEEQNRFNEELERSLAAA